MKNSLSESGNCPDMLNRLSTYGRNHEILFLAEWCYRECSEVSRVTIHIRTDSNLRSKGVMKSYSSVLQTDTKHTLSLRHGRTLAPSHDILVVRCFRLYRNGKHVEEYFPSIFTFEAGVEISTTIETNEMLHSSYVLSGLFTSAKIHWGNASLVDSQTTLRTQNVSCINKKIPYGINYPNGLGSRIYGRVKHSRFKIISPGWINNEGGHCNGAAHRNYVHSLDGRPLNWRLSNLFRFFTFSWF